MNQNLAVGSLAALLALTLILMACNPANTQFPTLAFGILTGLTAFLQVKPPSPRPPDVRS